MKESDILKEIREKFFQLVIEDQIDMSDESERKNALFSIAFLYSTKMQSSIAMESIKKECCKLIKFIGLNNITKEAYINGIPITVKMNNIPKNPEIWEEVQALKKSYHLYWDKYGEMIFFKKP